MTSRKVRGERLLFFCVEDGWVLTRYNYEACKGAKHNIRPFHPWVRQWRLTAAGRKLAIAHFPVAA